MLLLFQFATGGAMEAAFERATGAGYPLRLEGPVWGARDDRLVHRAPDDLAPR